MVSEVTTSNWDWVQGHRETYRRPAWLELVFERLIEYSWFDKLLNKEKVRVLLDFRSKFTWKRLGLMRLAIKSERVVSYISSKNILSCGAYSRVDLCVDTFDCVHAHCSVSFVESHVRKRTVGPWSLVVLSLNRSLRLSLCYRERYSLQRHTLKACRASFCRPKLAVSVMDKRLKRPFKLMLVLVPGFVWHC